VSQVLFGQSYYLRFDPKLWAAMQPYPPLGTLYAAAYVRSRGYAVALFDAMLDTSEAAWEQALAREQPQFAVLYEDNFNYLSKMCLLRMREAAFQMIGMARARECTVIVAGSDASDHADLYLAAGAQFVIVGEGEYTLAELLDGLTGRSAASPTTIAGLEFTDPVSGDLVRTPPRPDIKDLDALPFPAWDLVDVAHYRQIWQRRHGYYSMNMVTTRGCPYHCNWCAKPIWGQRYHSRSPENVAAELQWLRDTYQPDHIWFADDILGLKPGWLARFADLIEERQVRIPFKSLQRVDLVLKGDTAESLRRAGAQTVWVGAESGSQKILDAMEKGTRVEQISDATRRLQAAGIAVGFFLQFGYPGETRADIELTLQMVRDCRPDDIGMSVSYPLPGTRFHDSVQQQLSTRRNWTDSADLAMLYQGPFGSDFYRQLHTVLHLEFRARRAWTELRRVLHQPAQLRPQHLRRTAAMLHHLLLLPSARRKLDELMEETGPRLRAQRAPSAQGQHCGADAPLETEAATQPFKDRSPVFGPRVPSGPAVAALPRSTSRLLDTQRAFDGVAGDYDGPSGNNALVQRMRERLWRTVEETFTPGARLLDLGCGTGLDAVHLARRGYQVVALDSSPRMVARTRARAEAAGLLGAVPTEVLDMHQLDHLAGESFDGVYSNLGAINCALDLPSVARSCAALLRPNGRLVASVIGRWCPWEIAYYGVRGQFRRALLRRSRAAVPVALQGRAVWTRYWTPREFYGAFAPGFALTHYRALGLFLPPPYLIGLHRRFAALSAALGRLDDRLCTLPPARDLGDHFLMVLTRRD